MVFCPIPVPFRHLSLDQLRPVSHSNYVTLFDEMRMLGLPKELQYLKHDIDMFVGSHGAEISLELQKVINSIEELKHAP
jgi:hypothetical protein